MSRVRASAMYSASLSVSAMSLVIMAQKNSTGIIGLEIGGLIGDQRVGGGVGFVESVAGELFENIEDLVGLGAGMPFTRAAPATKLARCFAISSGFFLPMARRSRSAPPRV
jgi:hypothetical protein